MATFTSPQRIDGEPNRAQVRRQVWSGARGHCVATWDRRLGVAGQVPVDGIAGRTALPAWVAENAVSDLVKRVGFSASERGSLGPWGLSRGYRRPHVLAPC